MVVLGLYSFKRLVFPLSTTNTSTSRHGVRQILVVHMSDNLRVVSGRSVSEKSLSLIKGVKSLLLWSQSSNSSTEVQRIYCPRFCSKFKYLCFPELTNKKDLK